MILSIIVTVYNKEPYIIRCLSSCINQVSVSSDSYEILIINDGSTDNSKTLIENYLVGKKNIRLISQENLGLSIARNNGIKEAKGKYVWFVDADDIVSENAVSLILNAALNSSDVIPIQSITEGLPGIRNRIPVSVKDGKEVLLSGKWSFCSPFYIFRKAFLDENDLRFYPGIYHEDSELTPRLLFYAQTVSVLPNVLYTVTRDPNSITQVPRIQRAFDYIFIADRLDEFKKKVVGGECKLVRIYDHIISVIINNALHIVCGFDSNQRKEFDEKLYQKRNVLRSLKRGGHVKYTLEYCLFRIFPKCYTSIYESLRHLA